MKKVLSWVLVLALVLGSFSMAFAGDTDNASNFKDAAQIKNVEAVDVMVATGIIGGYPDGNFYPEKTVTRAEMAKMICIAVNGGEDVGSYYASSCKFADSKDHWAAGYIAYCANEGIIDGRSEDVFDPDATVTGTEAAKMMLVAIGYDSKIEKLTGEQWAANVLKLAKANDLFDGCDDFAAGAPLTRDNAAQIIFNGLQAEMVDYIFDAEITTGDTTVTVNTKVQGLDEALYEDAFDDDLVKAEGEADDFGRPAHIWSLDKDEIGTYADTPEYAFISTLGCNDEDDELIDAIEAYDENLFDKFDDGDYEIDDRFIINGEYDDEFEVCEGMPIELYDVDDEDTDAVEYLAVGIYYDTFQITEIDTIVSAADEKDGVSAYVTLANEDWGFEETYNDTDIPGFDSKTYVEDAVIAGVLDNDDYETLLDTFIPEKVTGEVTKVTYGAKDYTVAVDGKDYLVSCEYYPVDGNGYEVENTYDFYLINGYVYTSVLVEEESDTLYGLYLDKGADSGNFGDSTDLVKIFTAEGKEEVYAVSDDEDDNVDLRIVSEDTPALVAYTLNDDGEVDSLAVADETVEAGEDKAVSANGIFDGKLVDKNVVVFNDDNDDADDPDWAVYGYDEFAAAEKGIACEYITNDDGDIIAVYTTDGTLISKTTTVIGFYTGEDNDVSWSDKDGEYYTMTYFVNGAEKKYSTIDWDDVEQGDVGWDVGEPMVLTLNADGLITKIAAPNFDEGTPTDDFGDFDGITSGDLKTVKEVKGNSIDVGTDETDLQYAGAAAVYTFNEDGDFVKSSLSKIKAGYEVVFFQVDEDSNAWDVVVFLDGSIQGE